jgi:drug/metabolite transporter (DMT)-like permease
VAAGAVEVEPGTGRARSPLAGQLAMLASVTCFALSFSVIKWPGTSGAVIAWWRLAVSTGLWWALLLVRRRRTGRALPSRDTWRAVAPAALCFGVNISVLFTAVTRTSVIHAEFISALTPLVLPVLGLLLFRERPHWRSLRWGALTLAGIVIVLATSPAGGVATVGGDLLMLVSVAAYIGYLLNTKRARAAGVQTVEFMAIMMPVALITATPVALWVSADEFIPRDRTTWAAIGILAVLTGMAAHGFLVFAQRSVPISQIGVIQSSQPAQSTFWAWVFLGEAVAVAQIPGMALAVIGSALVVWTAHRARD